MLTDQEYWRIVPVHGWPRTLLPIYGVDQFAVLGGGLLFVFVIGSFSGNLELAAYMIFGAYIGIVVTMIRSTPSRMLIPEHTLKELTQILDASPFLERQSESLVWDRKVGRMKKWNSDRINLVILQKDIEIHGRLVDLEAIRSELR